MAGLYEFPVGNEFLGELKEAMAAFLFFFRLDAFGLFDILKTVQNTFSPKDIIWITKIQFSMMNTSN
jgi:hypothetical protein